jgi:osmotically-inducible protein OsmY
MCHPTLNVPALVVTSAALVLIGALPAQASEMDRKIESSAKETYNFKTCLKDDDIKVYSSAGVVTLTGTVAQEDHKVLARETVAGLPGVKSVVNMLTVAGEQPEERSDRWIAMKVKMALTFHKNVSATATEVQCRNGIVTLSGNVDTEADKHLTGECAKDVEGVTEVRNDLVVTTVPPAHEGLGEKVDDASIIAQIKTALLFRKSTHALATHVTAHEGVVTLRGEARSAKEKSLVTRIAEDIKGVKQVDNRMTLRQP